MYLNINGQKKLYELEESIFSIKSWNKEFQKKIKSTNSTLENLINKEIEEGKKEFKKNYKENYQLIKEYNLKLLPVLHTFHEYKSLMLKLAEVEPVYKQFAKRSQYEALSQMGPVFINLHIKEGFKYGIINIPERSFISKLFGNGIFILPGSFNRKDWIELEKNIALYHESVEWSEYAKKYIDKGNFFILSKDNYYRVGQHNSIIVLAKEAVILNTHKDLPALKELRNFRKLYEWKIIKKKTGVDFSLLKSLDEKTTNKLLSSRIEKFGDEEGFFLKDNELNIGLVNPIKSFKGKNILLRKIDFSKLSKENIFEKLSLV